MVIKFSGKNKENNPYEYYVCSRRQNKFVDKCTTKNIRVDVLDSKILTALKAYDKDILLKTLKESAESLNSSFESERMSGIKSEISENESSMNNLIKQLSRATSETVSNRLMDEINSLDKNIQDLKKQLDSLQAEKSSAVNASTDVKYLMDSLKHLDKTMNFIEDTTQKRFLMQCLVKSAVWDSHNNDVEIIL